MVCAQGYLEEALAAYGKRRDDLARANLLLARAAITDGFNMLSEPAPHVPGVLS
jgi:hypothetical protein